MVLSVKIKIISGIFKHLKASLSGIDILNVKISTNTENNVHF